MLISLTVESSSRVSHALESLTAPKITTFRCKCWFPNWNEPQTNSGTPQFGNQFGESPYRHGDCFFGVFFSVTHKIGLFSPKIEAIPTPWRTSPHQKFRQPTHCAGKSIIRRTREGAASPHIADWRCCAARVTTSSCTDNNTATTSAIPIFNYDPQF
jgi:hypothetical protein